MLKLTADPPFSVVMGTGEESPAQRHENAAVPLLSQPSSGGTSGLEPLRSAGPQQTPPEAEMTLHQALPQG